ncbi:MAG: FMN-binding protein [Prevotella sp.]|nr:FMN-binding protein [Prevotella sp.]
MKKIYISFLLFALALTSFVADETMTKEDGAFVINTTEIGKNVEGYQGTTPLKVYIKNNKVEKIEFLKSTETPKYYAKVKKALQDKWNGLKVKDAKAQQVDAVTGATFSSEAVIENVRLALDYYQNHKK